MSKNRGIPVENSPNGKVGEGIVSNNAAWTFGGDVAKNFSGHVRRSVPFYENGHDLVCKLSDFFVSDTTVCYELGCATGVLLGKLAARHKAKKSRFIGIDLEASMIAQAEEENGNTGNVEFVADDIFLYPYEKSDLIIAYYTIQFAPPYLRQKMIDKIYQSLNWGGAFIMFEKVRAPDARFQEYMTALYTEFKLEQGYLPDEIIAKARSLKRVLEPFSTQGNFDLLKQAGFVDYMTVQKYVCFEGFLAIK